ncbi:sodium-driven chloride bicarbonate exchanger-like [Sinocyclocheilus grahami]|uniref:sodium-driven chloride bicarbonate exchanger-like n=1 Tax=Sinocyclocheilus grahami TaxID=75366 RepID=UPI0007ACC86B|nr:PREDICTED: sodium-driven chloride bicarbonate exchanger-like [Sinocyclocheilus grahami]
MQNLDLYSRLDSQRNDEEAVVDRGGTHSMLKAGLEKEELEGHRTLYIGVHVPLGRRSHRRHRHHGHRHRKRSRERDSGVEDGHESPSYSNIHPSFSDFLTLCFSPVFQYKYRHILNPIKPISDQQDQNC